MDCENLIQKVLFGNIVLITLTSVRNMTSYLKMVSAKKKAMCILRFFKTNSVIEMQHIVWMSSTFKKCH
jgi:hypothetical protein